MAKAPARVPAARFGASLKRAARTRLKYAQFGIRKEAKWALSSAGEHYVDIVGVTGSIPVAPTISSPDHVDVQRMCPNFGRREISLARV